MPRKRKLKRSHYREQKKIYHALRLEEKIRKMRQAHKAFVPEPLTKAERALMAQVESYRRAERFEALELELMNFERKAVGLRPFESFPVDPAVEQAAADFEIRRGRHPGRIGVRR